MKTALRALLATLTVLSMTMLAPVAAGADGATQIAGLGFPDFDGDCDLLDADYAIIMTGDLEGCLYGFVDADSVRLRPSGTYFERGTEIFVSGGDPDDRFSTTYVFTGKFTEDGQQYGRCQHPIVDGQGLFDGVTGRLDFKDNIVDGAAENFSYRGHLKFG